MTDIIKGESREDYMARNNVYLSKWAWESKQRLQSLGRFEVVLTATPNVYYIKDNDFDKYDMPERAVAINMSEESANAVAAVLNREWHEFVRNPK